MNRAPISTPTIVPGGLNDWADLSEYVHQPLALAGLFFMFGIKYIPLFRLPGDIFIKRGNFSFYFPLEFKTILV